MNATVIATKVISSLLLLPASLILLCVVGMLLRRSYPSVGIVVSFASLLLLFVLSTEVGTLLLAGPLERRVPALEAGATGGAQAIVVLGGGRISNAPEYGGEDIPNYQTLARLRYGAKLQRQTGLPVLVSGGMPDGSRVSEAVLMANSLQEDFAVPVKWREEASDDTAQNAKFSAVILQQAGVRKILLVTDALHMPRAQMMFAQAGLEVVIAPTIFFSHERLTLRSFLPSGKGMYRSDYALHEWLGILWFKIRSGQSQQAGEVAAAS
ncbi:YdcF family protein [Collimonas humicola]|uniref:YdcF family protein n=1 Tax=Collimonas humicola TaxID=2825886 RepID=UPI001B8C6833|nr:YdcF family protein [Collimonas humicola]